MRQLASPHHHVLTEGQAWDLAAVLHVLANPVRLQLLSLLLAAPDGLTTTQLQDRLCHRTQSTVSHHMMILAGAGFVTRVRATHPYRVVPGALSYVASFLGGS